MRFRVKRKQLGGEPKRPRKEGNKKKLAGKGRMTVQSSREPKELT